MGNTRIQPPFTVPVHPPVAPGNDQQQVAVSTHPEQGPVASLSLEEIRGLQAVLPESPELAEIHMAPQEIPVRIPEALENAGVEHGTDTKLDRLGSELQKQGQVLSAPAASQSALVLPPGSRPYPMPYPQVVNLLKTGNSHDSLVWYAKLIDRVVRKFNPSFRKI
jgi:hypothetical protein